MLASVRSETLDVEASDKRSGSEIAMGGRGPGKVGVGTIKKIRNTRAVVMCSFCRVGLMCFAALVGLEIHRPSTHIMLTSIVVACKGVLM